jgi:hypothetical protein
VLKIVGSHKMDKYGYFFFNGKGPQGSIDAALNPGCGTSYKHGINIHIKYNLVMEVHT